MDTTKAFRTYLAKSLQVKSRMNSGQVGAILARYDKAVIKHEPRKVFFELMESYASEDSAKAIQRALEEANKQTININPITRIRDNIARFKQNIGKMDVEIVGVDVTRLASHQLDGIQDAHRERERTANPVIPKAFTCQAVVNFHNYSFPISVEWTL